MKLLAFTIPVHSLGLWEQNTGVQGAALGKAALKCHPDFGEALGAT